MTKKHGILRIKEKRTASGLTQEALARKAGFSLGYIARLETGRHDPPLSTLIKLAKVLKVKAGELLE
jgi:transcriptional regulator with XRE-family HTH domain